jgi:hypothetical protein
MEAMEMKIIMMRKNIMMAGLVPRMWMIRKRMTTVILTFRVSSKRLPDKVINSLIDYILKSVC